MSIPYDRTGRTGQKARTRAALIAAARTLLAAGRTPTVEEAAETAGMSRATAYRYFPNREALLVASHPEIQATTLLADDAPSEPHERLELTIKELIRITLDTEPQLRAMLRLSLEPGGKGRQPLRQGRAIGWLTDALAPLSSCMPPFEFRRLILAIRTACGIEALIWLTDVAGLSREEAAETMCWSAQSLLRAALADQDPGDAWNERVSG